MFIFTLCIRIVHRQQSCQIATKKQRTLFGARIRTPNLEASKFVVAIGKKEKNAVMAITPDTIDFTMQSHLCLTLKTKSYACIMLNIQATKRLK